MLPYSLQIGTGPVTPFSSLPIASATLRRTTWADDALQIATTELFDDADLIPAFSRVRLYEIHTNGSSVLRYTGWLDQAPRRATAAGEGKTYTISGPRRWLDRLSYDPPTSVYGGVLLGYEDTEEKRSRIHEQVSDVRTYANANGADLASSPTSGAWALYVPWESFQNASCLQALQSLLRWLPAWCLVSDEGTNLRWRDTLTSTIHAAADLLAEGRSLSLNPLYELLRSGVTIRYQQIAEGANLNTTTDSATGGQGASLGADRIELVVVPLDPTETRPENGLAAEYLRWVGKLQIATQLTTSGPRWEIEPGHRLEFSGLLSQWSSYDAVIQVLERDLFNETLTLTTGPRRHLGLDQLLDLRIRRRKTAPGLGSPGDPGQSPGGKSPDGDSNGSSTSPFALAVTSAPGSPSTTRIRVYPSTLAGGSSTDLGFSEGDEPPFLLVPEEGILVGGITVDQQTGEVTSRSIEILSEMPADTDDTFYVEIGTIALDAGTWSVSNSRYGPINVQICRNWYAAEEPYFGVTWL